MYYAEHRFLGDTTQPPTDVNQDSNGATDKVTLLELENKLLVTYGEINGFAGDYFGYERPISSASNFVEMKELFQSWFNLLGVSEGGKAKAEALRAELKVVNDQVVRVLQSATGGTGDELAEVYKKTPLNVWRMDDISKDTRWAKGASFLRLAETNIDHFGDEARLTYNAGHSLAIDCAVKGDLSKALAINGFADHFLQDSFAAGHLRVPRAKLWDISKVAVLGKETAINLSSNVMHNEDGEIGVWVESPSGEKWKAFGDGRLPGKDTTGKGTSTTLDQCRKALRQSVQEIHDAYTSKKPLQQDQSAVWQHAPILDKISSDPDNHRPLVKVQEGKIYVRVNGLKSEKYEEVDDLWQWAMFYMSNIVYLEGQAKLLLQKVFGGSF